jgi:guanylate kinase
MKPSAPQPAKRRGIIFIVSAPSGAGKTTLIRGLRSLFPDIKLSVSYTTRGRRNGEVNGRDYYFVKAERFDLMRNRGEFAEWANVHGFLYGTPREQLERSLRTGRDILLDIDVQGAQKIKRAYPEAVSVFLLPPSWQELQRRLAARGTDRKETIRRRLANARGEIQQIIDYDYYVVNREIQEALELLKAIVQAERAKVVRVSQWRIAPLQTRWRSGSHR